MGSTRQGAGPLPIAAGDNPERLHAEGASIAFGGQPVQVSGRDMMAALIAGERDPTVLARLARSRMRSKTSLLEEAFTGHFTEHHAFLLQRMLARIDAINDDITALDAKIEEMILPFAQAIGRLDEIPEIGPIAAAVIVAEVGLEMARFPTAGQKESAGEEEGQRLNRARQPLPRPHPRRGRHRRCPRQHLPRRTLGYRVILEPAA